MRGRIRLILAVTAVGLLAWAASASAATFTVTKTADTNDGSCTPANCSLRDAVNASNATAGPNAIAVPAGSYGLPLGELGVTQSVTISGASPAKTTVDGGGASRIFHVTGGTVNFTIQGLTLTRGKAPDDGGAVYNASSGSTTVSNSAFTNNSAGNGSDGFGGAIYQSSGALTLTDAGFTGNLAGGSKSGDDGIGGAIDAGAGGAVTATRVSMTNNHAGGNGANGFGGVLNANGAVSFTDATLSNNTAGGGGSGTGIGGALDASKGATLHRVTLQDNTSGGGGPFASGFGGAINGPVTATNSTFIGNHAGGGGGSANGFGGAINGPVTAANTTIADNLAGGDGAYGFGGGIDGTTTLAYSTVAGNSAQVTAGGGRGGGVSGALTSTASIVADNTSAVGTNCDTAATSHGYNIENGTSCGFTGTGDLNADPKLAPTADNGGPGPTRRLLAGSPAIDHVPTSAGCPTTDERGVHRPQGPACDTGAYEAAPPSATTGSASISRAGVVTFRGSGSNPDAVAGSAYFQYGRSSAYGSTSPAQSVPAGAHSAALSFSTTKLKGRSTYHYRLVVANPDGTSYGADAKYRTPAKVKLSHLKIKPHSFKHGHRATISFRSSLKGSITFTVLVHRHQKWVKLGSFTHRDKRGKNHLRLPSRVGGKKLKAGSYRLSVTASSPFKLPTTAVRSFKIT